MPQMSPFLFSIASKIGKFNPHPNKQCVTKGGYIRVEILRNCVETGVACAALTSRLYSSTRLSIVSFASPEEPSMRLFSAERDRMRSSLAARAVSNSFTLECKAVAWKKKEACRKKNKTDSNTK